MTRENIKMFQLSLRESNLHYQFDVNLSSLTNTKTGGICPAVVYPHNQSELTSVLQLANQNEVKFYVLGEMTNVAVASGTLNFIVIDLLEFDNQIHFNSHECIVTVGAGVKMKKLSRWAFENSLTGLQWMEGIPGTVGAGAYMNAGFLPGQDFQSFLVDAKVLTYDGVVRTLTNHDMHYGYRVSSIQANGGVIISVRLLLRKGKHFKIGIRMWQYHQRRVKHQPLELPSAGTVFIPPMPYHVGGMIPRLGLTGYQIGGAAISTKSPGFIVAKGDMSGEDYYNLVKFIQKKVYDTYKINLIPEVRLLGFNHIDGKINE